MPGRTRPPADPVRRRRLTALLVAVVVVVGALELLVGPADERFRHGASLERI
jgi:hypothetical protein